MRIDLHMHTTRSDGTDAPETILEKVKAAGIDVFSVTDHDAIVAARLIPPLLAEGDPRFIPGVEFSCRDEEGKYHILGYGYDPNGESIQSVVRQGRELRQAKLKVRLDYLEERFGFHFSKEATREIWNHYNPGKPHLGNLLVQLGYAKTKEEAIDRYINGAPRVKNESVRPETAIAGILESGGIPVLAHPSYGSGSELVLGDALERRVQKLMGFGLKGLEAYYSSFTPKIRAEVLTLADRYDLFVTAGSDYHGTNKLVALGETGLDGDAEPPERLRAFLEAVRRGA